MLIRKAERKKAKLRMAFCGVSNSGKTMSAIKMAKGMGGKIIVINTEKEGPDLYEDIADFDVIDIDAPYTPEKYINAIKVAEKANYDIIIIDSLSHAWAGTGGLLEIQDNITQASKSKNSYMAWRQVTPMYNKLVDAILQSSAHVIATMRAKAHHDLVDDGKGNKKPVKIGLAPIQRDGIEYEFTLVMDLDHETHLYTASKDRTRLFEGKHEKVTEEHGIVLKEWLSKGKEVIQEDKKINDREMVEELQLEIPSYIHSLENSASMEELQNHFKAAYHMFKDMPEELQRIVETKDKRKMQLQGEAA